MSSEVYLLVNLFSKRYGAFIRQWIAFILGLLLHWRDPFHIQSINGTKDQNLVEKYLHIPRGKWLNYMYLQTVETLIRRRILQHLIWVCTVCQVPFYGSPDYNGLIALFCFVFKQVQYEFFNLPNKYLCTICVCKSW